MSKEVVVWEAVKETGNFLTSVSNFTASVGSLVSSYRISKQVDRTKVNQLLIHSNKIIQKMKDDASYEILVNRMELISKAVEKACSAPDPLSKKLCMDYVAQLHSKFKDDFT